MNKILIIEDDVITQKILKKVLQSEAFEVIEATSGEQGLAHAIDLHPAVIICDWELPGMDGLSVCQQIKTDAVLSMSYFIFLTAHGNTERQVQGLDCGADDFLMKPINPEELKARVRAGLRLFQSQQEQRTLTKQLQAQQLILNSQMAEAAEYVRSLLPAPVCEPVAISYQFLPSQQLGGDCFDYYWLDPEYLAVYLLDVSGHGLGSALVSVSIQNLLRSQSLPRVNFYRPDHVLSALNATFQIQQENDRYFTIWYGVYNCQKRELFYSSAGHPPAILLSNTPESTQIQSLKTPGMPIGMFAEAKYVSHRCKVESNSTLYIFSDGIYEITRPSGELWSLNEFMELLNQQRDRASLESILEQVQFLQGQPEFEDDCSLLKLELN